MTTTQFRFGLADLPYDSGNSFEITLDNANTSGAKERRQEGQSWPDTAGVAFASFSIFVVNATVFIIWLVILSFLIDWLPCDPRNRTWLAIFLCTSGIFVLVNVYAAYAAKGRLESKVVACCAYFAAIFWFGIALGGTRYVIRFFEL